MLGIAGLRDAPLEYCWQLIQEYSILHNAQIHVLLKKHSSLTKNDRHRLFKSLRKQWRIRDVHHNDSHYITNNAKMTPTGNYQKQIACFWVLINYFDKAQNHYATGTFTRISMEIEGRDFSIVYVGIGDEALCQVNIEKGGETMYIVVVENIEQMKLIHSEKIRTFAMVDEKGKVRYFTVKKEDGSL